VVLSFSDSDLGAFGAAWHAARADDPAFPDMRLANLAALAHPLSVDTYVERTLGGARAILIRLIGGEAYWAYGLSQVSLLARAQGIALAVLPGDGRPDPRLDSYSTVPPKPCARSTGSARKAARPPPARRLPFWPGRQALRPEPRPPGKRRSPLAAGTRTGASSIRSQ
jgi:cobalamin biosynthesis Mg chelatase CobN